MITILIVVVLMIMNTQQGTSQNALLGGVFIATGIASFWSVLALSAKRIHDMDWSIAAILLLFIPMVAFAFVLVLALLPGSQKTNKHGPPPFPESGGLN